VANPIELKPASQLHWWGYRDGDALVITPVLLSRRIYAALAARVSDPVISK
jgi:hypothetical protein